MSHNASSYIGSSNKLAQYPLRLHKTQQFSTRKQIGQLIVAFHHHELCNKTVGGA